MHELSDIAEHSADLAMVQRVSGEFVGNLTDHEFKAFRRLCRAGLAYRAYRGAAGFLGLAKVAVQADLFGGQR